MNPETQRRAWRAALPLVLIGAALVTNWFYAKRDEGRLRWAIVAALDIGAGELVEEGNVQWTLRRDKRQQDR